VTVCRTPTSCVNDAVLSFGAWTNPQFAQTLDGSRATFQATGASADDTCDATKCTQLLKCTGYGFSVPTLARIDGIQVNFTLHASGTGATTKAVRVVRSGTPIGGDPSYYTAWSTTTDSSLSYGGPTDTWLEYWTPADINDAGFGAGISALFTTGGVIANVNQVQTCVTYTEIAANPTPTFTPVGVLNYNIQSGSSGGCPVTQPSTANGAPQDQALTNGSMAYHHGLAQGSTTFCLSTTDFYSPWCNLASGRRNCGDGLTYGDSWSTVGGAIPLAIEPPDAAGRARLTLQSSRVLSFTTDGDVCGDSAANETTNCKFCILVRPDPRPAQQNFVDCDGGSNVDLLLAINSATSGAAPPPVNTPALVGTPHPQRTPGQGTEAGHAVLHVLAKIQQLNVATCPGPADSSWNKISDAEITLSTGIGEARIDNALQCGSTLGISCPARTSAGRYHATLYGRPFSGVGANCSTWSSASGGALVAPAVILNQYLSSSLNPPRTDLAVVMRAVQQ
jgi:hypothetical protein